MYLYCRECVCYLQRYKGGRYWEHKHGMGTLLCFLYNDLTSQNDYTIDCLYSNLYYNMYNKITLSCRAKYSQG